MNPLAGKPSGRTLKKRLRPHRSDYWCIPSIEDADFIAAMEDVLDVYELPYDPFRSVVCMDEKPYQLLRQENHGLCVRAMIKKLIPNMYVMELATFLLPLLLHHLR